MDEKKQAVFFNGLRIGAGVFLAILLLTLYVRIETLGHAAIYAATWVTFIHLCIGEYVLVRYCHAQTGMQNSLDLLGFVFLVCGSLAFVSPALWCAFFGGLFALAVVKYMVVQRTTSEEFLKKYAREKALLESPAVIGLAILALVLDYLPPRSVSARIVELGILTITTAFAIWMIAIRHAYRKISGTVR